MSEIDMQPPDPVCRFCEDWCSGTCEGAREARQQDETDEITRALTASMEAAPRCDRCGFALRQQLMGPFVCDICH